jgi:hypothetical protein
MDSQVLMFLIQCWATLEADCYDETLLTGFAGSGYCGS